MKYPIILLALLVNNCFAERWIICSVRSSDNVALWHSDEPTSDTTHLESPPSGCTWQAFPKSTWAATATDAGDGVPVLVANAGRIVNRGAGVVAAERAVVARILATRQFLAWRQTLTNARQALTLAPGNAVIQAQVSAAASQVTTFASAASIPVTTATTQ